VPFPWVGALMFVRLAQPAGVAPVMGVAPVDSGRGGADLLRGAAPTGATPTPAGAPPWDGPRPGTCGRHALRGAALLACPALRLAQEIQSSAVAAGAGRSGGAGAARCVALPGVSRKVSGAGMTPVR
jgi:hypothetical protein